MWEFIIVPVLLNEEIDNQINVVLESFACVTSWQVCTITIPVPENTVRIKSSVLDDFFLDVYVDIL